MFTYTVSNPPTRTLTGTNVAGPPDVSGEIKADPSSRVLVLTRGGQGEFISSCEVGERAHSVERNIESRAGANPSVRRPGPERRCGAADSPPNSGAGT